MFLKSAVNELYVFNVFRSSGKLGNENISVIRLHSLCILPGGGRGF